MTEKKPPRNERFRGSSTMTSVRLDNAVLAAIDAAAKDDGVSRSEAIANAVREWLVAYSYLEPPPQLLIEKVRGSKGSN